MNTYTCGFAFNESLSWVLLIKKDRGPKVNIGKWNGLGGKLKVGEGIRAGMAREFEEECGLPTTPLQWAHFHTERYHADSGNKVYFMTGIFSTDFLLGHRQMESEMLSMSMVDGIMNHANVAYNLPYLLPMAKSWHDNPMERYMEG